MSQRIYKIRIQALYSGTSRNIFQDYKQPYNNYHGTAITITGDLKNPDYKEFIHPDAVDPCPNGDYSGSSNDGKCGKAPVEEEENSEEETGSEDILEQGFFTEMNVILQEFGIEEGIQTNSAETEAGKKQAIEDGRFRNEFIQRLHILLEEKIYTGIKSEEILLQKKILTGLNSKLRTKKGTNSTKNAFIDYIIYSFQEKIEEYDSVIYKGELNNPFEKTYGANFHIYAKQTEANIIMLLSVKGIDIDFMNQRYGGLYTKLSLNYLLEQNVINDSEYQKYSSYIPTVDGLLQALENEGNIHELLKAYYPERIGASDGMKQAISDFLVENISLIDPREVPQLLNGIVQMVGKLATGDIDVTQLADSVRDLYEIFKNRKEIFAGLEPYKQAYYESYLGTTLSLAIIPVKYGKAGKYVKGKGDTKDIENIKSFKKLKSIKVSTERKIHILDGDSKGGGHRYGTGKSGKTEFPKNWNDSKIINNIEDVISDKNSKIIEEGSGILQIFGTREGINIKVVVDPKTETVITAFPTNTPINH